MTRSRGVEAFEHVITKVLKLDKNSQLWKALEDDGFNTISDIATLTDDEINALQFSDIDATGNTSIKPVMKKQRKLLTHLLKWRDWTSRQLNKFDAEDWIKLTPETFNDFRENQLPDLIRSGSSATSPIPTIGTGVGIVTSSEVQLFKRSIDKSQNDFPKFNGSATKWTSIKQSYIAVASNHGIGRILTSDLVPFEGSKDRELFDVQNKYFYNILKLKITGGKAKVIVNQHAVDLDGRSAWRKFIDYYEQKGIVSLNKAHFFEKLSSMRLSVNYRGGPNKFLTDFETVLTDMGNTLGEDMADSDKVGFLTTAIADYQPFKSIKASLDTNALMTKSDISFDGMLQVLYNNCPSATKQQRSLNSVNSRQRGKSDQVNAWKKDFTLWVPHKIFKTLPESEQKARREALAKAKKAKRDANINATQIVPSDPDGTTMTVPVDLAPTFREIMSASKIDKKNSADGDTWLRIVKPCRVVKMFTCSLPHLEVL